MSRPRPISRTTGFNEVKEVMTDVWHELVNTMRQLPPMEPGSRIYNEEEDPIRPLQVVENEKKILDRALEHLDMLIALRRNEEQAIELARHTANQNVPTVTVQSSTPTSSGPTLNGKRKRRNSLSYSASPAPPILPNSADSTLSSIASPLPRSGTPGKDMKGKRDGLFDIPLQVGRKVAFRAPGKMEEEWILCTVQKKDPVDRNKLTVVDPDDGSTFVTDVRYLVPLPDSSAGTNSPLHPANVEEFPRGSQILAIFPDTTTLYRATVISGPSSHPNLKKEKEKDKETREKESRMYRVKFEDDEDRIRTIHYSLITKFPGN